MEPNDSPASGPPQDPSGIPPAPEGTHFSELLRLRSLGIEWTEIARVLDLPEELLRNYYEAKLLDLSARLRSSKPYRDDHDDGDHDSLEDDGEDDDAEDFDTFLGDGDIN